MIITVPDIPRGPNSRNGLFRMHWRARKQYCESWHWQIVAALGGNVPMCGELKSTVWIHQVRRRMLDTDNLYASCKPLLDSLQKTGVIFDDSPKWCDLRVTQEVGKPVRTLIEVIQGNYTENMTKEKTCQPSLYQ